MPLAPLDSCASKFTYSDFCRLLITFANSLDPDQAQQNVGPDLDQNFSVPDRIFFEKNCFGKISAMTKKHTKLPYTVKSV